MKVKIEFTVDVNKDDWEMAFGLEDTAEIRQDIKDRARYIFIGQCENDGIDVR